MSENTSNQTKKIAALNDIFRQTMGLIGGGSVIQTQWVSALPEKDQSRIRELVQTFNKFSSDNDPYEEHDFSIVSHMGESIYWKIDYYDKDCRYGSENPADTSQTHRVLTIMHAHEY